MDLFESREEPELRRKPCDVRPDRGFRFRDSVSSFGFRVSGFGFWVLGFGFRVSGFGFRVSGFGFRFSVFNLWVSGLGFGFRVRVSDVGSEIRVSGPEFRVYG